MNKVLKGDLDVNPKELVNILPLQPSDRKRAKEALARDDFVVTLDGVVTQEHCDRLITFAKWAMPSTVTGAASNEVDRLMGRPRTKRTYRKRPQGAARLGGLRAITSPGLPDSRSDAAGGFCFRAQVFHYFQAALTVPLRRLRRVHLREFS